tara:strand:+ start:1261 stop:1662 length:402 start_codon:yes stop_codon:yes gene_type:complete
MGSYVDSLREAARRLLRSEGGILYLNRSIKDDAIKMMLKISDIVPSKISFPELSYIESQEILLECSGNNFYIGEEEKSEEYCWVKSHKSETGESWDDFRNMVLELAIAGYPGCIGCGGPGSEEIWDESNSRIY